MRRSLLVGLMLSTVVLSAGVGHCAEPSSRPSIDFFEQRVRPILLQHCQACHGPKKQESGLRLDIRAGAMRGGDDGPAVVPGKPEESLLIDAVKYGDREMPPDGKLGDQDIAALEQWVRLGAPWPEEPASTAPALGDQALIFEAAKTHWAFQPINKPQVPSVVQQDWVRTPVDAFILAQLEEAGLQPAPGADRRTVIRRLTMDLIGLPPTPEEVAAYVADRSPRAYATLVDRLLASPHYGERWGRHWLDVARYADTRDWVAVSDLRYPFAYTYRDWVIQALNDDLPLDDFIRQQVAADQYTDDAHSPNLAALGFLTVGPRFRNGIHDQLADEIDVVTRGLLGLTAACARCHDHKYDPIPTADYYALYGVFASSEIPDRLPVIGESAVSPEVERDYQEKLAAAQANFTKYKTDLRDKATAHLHERIADYLRAWYTMSVTETESVRSVISKFKLKEIAVTPLAKNLDSFRKTAAGREDPVLGPLALLVSVPKDKYLAKRDFLLAQSRATGKRGVQVNAAVVAALKKQQPADAAALVDMYGELLARAEKTSPADRKQDPALGEIYATLHNPDGPFTLEVDAVVSAARLLGAARNEQFKYQAAVQDVESLHPGAPARAMVLVDKAEPITPSIFLRGDPRRRGDRVPRHFLSILAGKEPPQFTHGSGRRDLAEDLVDPKNPLTARVMANRVWMHHFGKSLVSSPGDFGLRTPQPMQSDLLDWLAATLVEQKWSLKKLHRVIVFSNTYRQMSEPPAAALAGRPDPQAVDPDNQLYWRANRRRLEFEAMRDAILVASGQLDPTIGGRPVKLSEPPFTNRRTVYGYVDRANLDDVFATFDFPSPDQSNPQRSETMVPQQALFAMNDPFIVEQARKLAGLPEVASAKEPADKVKALYRRVYVREPRPREVVVAEQFVAASVAAAQSQPAGGTWQYGYGASDPRAAAEDRFHALKFWSGKSYQASAAFPDPQLSHVKLSATGGHPGNTQETAAVRRWVAPRDMTVQIQGTLTHLSDRGDGVRGQIISAQGDVLGSWTVLNQNVPTAVKPQHVRAGETLDFVVDCHKKATSDNFNWTVTIEVAGAMAGEQKSGQKWGSREDFAAPPPAPLTAWEQLAQALLLTNEFMFFD